MPAHRARRGCAPPVRPFRHDKSADMTKYNKSAVSATINRSQPQGIARVLGGVLASTIAVPITFPLVSVQVAQQVRGKTPASTTVSGDADGGSMWDGLLWAVGSAVAGHTAYFGSFEMIFVGPSEQRHGQQGRSNESECKSLENASHSSSSSGKYIVPMRSSLMARTLLSSAVATVFNTPFEILKTRSIAGAPPPSHAAGAASAAHDLLAASTDWDSLLRGFAGNISGLLGTSIQFSVYHSLLPRVAGQLALGSPPQAGLSAATGVLASGVATTLTFPIDTVKSMVMADVAGSLTYQQAAAALLQARGLVGFYDGLGPALWRNAATALVTFLMYPVLTQMLGTLIQKMEDRQKCRKHQG